MSRRGFIVLSLLLDAILVNVGFVGGFLLRFGGALPSFNFNAYLGLAPILTVLYLASGWVYGLYEPERTDSGWSVVRAVFPAVTLGTLLTAAVAFFGGPAFASFARLAILIAYVLILALLVGWRLLFLRFGGIAWPEQRVLLIGTSDLAVDLAHELAGRAKWGYRVSGLVDAGAPEGGATGALAAGESDAVPSQQLAETPRELGGVPVLGSLDAIAEVANEQRSNRVIVVSPVNLRELVERLALADEVEDMRIDVVPELYEIFIGTMDASVGDIPLMEVTRSTVPPYYRAAKRGADLLFSGLLLVFLSPILLLAAVAVLLSSGWPVFYSQKRAGENAKPFTLYKFRTMRKDAEELSGPVLATEDDPRITPVGRFLRRFRIDELPQLANILLGQMSFVGPRPERPFFVERFSHEIPGYRERFHVKPGVTGLAQVSGDYATTPERKLKYDLIYMYHQDFLMDLQILLETVRVVLTGRGAR